MALVAAAHAQRPLGTDISAYQPNVNWTTVKNAGIAFVWSKATEGGSWTSGYFVSQQNGAKSVGIPIGAYHFARPSANPNLTGANSAETEAAHFWSVAGPYIKSGGGYLVPMLDWEDTNAKVSTGFTSAANMSAWVIQWCNTVSNYAYAAGVPGLRPVIYTGAWYSRPSSTYPGLTTAVTSWPSWIAAYPTNPNPQTGGPSDCYPWSTWNIWQYADTNWSGGDSDVFNGTLAAFNQKFIVGGGNGATVVSSSVPSSLLTGQTFTATITLNNSGSSTWTNTGSNLYRLGSQSPQDNTTWGFNRVPLPSASIAPGANATFTFNARAPSTPGVYTFAWQMVQEGVKWFGDIYSSTLVVKLPGPGTNGGSYTIDTGNMDSTSRNASYVSFTTSTCSGNTCWYSYGVPEAGSNCTVFDRDIRWIPPLPQYGFSGRGYLTASALIPDNHATATVNFFAVDAQQGNDLPISGSVNECAYGCSYITFYSGSVNVPSFGGFRSNTKDDGPPGSGGCSTACGTFPAGYSKMHIQAARWQYLDDWTCLGSYASTNVSDTSNRSFNEANLYLYPAVDTSHGNAIATALGLNGKTPGRVTTGDCNYTNTLNFAGTNNGVNPPGIAADYGNANNADAYGFAWVFAPAGASPQIVIGSDDGNRLWVNGVLKNDKEASRSLTRDQDNTGMVTLPAGWSRILFKVHNITGGFQGTVSLRNGSNANLNEPSVNYFDLGGYYSYGLGYEQDGWYPQIVVANFCGASNPANGAAFYGNNPVVTASGTSSGQGPVPYWRTMQFQWGYGLGNADADYADVSGTPTSTSWSHTTTGVSGHRRFHFFAVSQSGRTSFQDSGSSGGWLFQDAGNYARCYDVYVDNVAPQPPSFSSVSADSSSQISLGWSLPLDQGVNVEPGATESAGSAGNQDAQNWYRVGDVGVQVYRDGAVLSPWSTSTAMTDSGLTANTPHTYALAARDNSTATRGAWFNATGLQGATTVWTLSAPPAADSIIASPSYPRSGSNVVWTAVNGFGPGQVQYYRYAWDTVPTHTWTDTEPQWSDGTLTTVPTAAGTWYLHVKGYNGADVGNGSFDYAVTATACSQTNSIVGIADNQDGTFTLTFAGTAQSRYYVMATADPNQPSSWTPVTGSTNTVTAPSGLWTCTVTNIGMQQFYRSVALTPCQ